MEIVNLLFTWVIGPAVTLLLGGLVGRRMAVAEASKKQAEVKTNELENVQSAVKIWREVAESLQEKIRDQDLAMSELKQQLEKVIFQNTELLKDMETLKKDYGKLLKNYNSLKNSISQ